MQEYIFDTYWGHEKTATITVSADRKSVHYVKYTNEVPKIPYLFDDLSVEHVYRFLESRCMPRQRNCLQQYLDDLGLEEYNPWDIVKITHGVMWEDMMWIKFPDEMTTWEDVKVRD